MNGDLSDLTELRLAREKIAELENLKKFHLDRIDRDRWRVDEVKRLKKKCADNVIAKEAQRLSDNNEVERLKDVLKEVQHERDFVVRCNDYIINRVDEALGVDRFGKPTDIHTPETTSNK